MLNYPIGRKVYVEVNEEHLPGGGVCPRSFVWEDGTRYDVDKILCIYPSLLLKASGYQYRYTVRVGGCKTFMFLEEADGKNLWFMERRKNKAQGGKRYDVPVAV